VFGLVCLRFLP